MVKKKNSGWVRFGQELRRTRQGSGMSQEQLAKAVNVSPALVSAIERGERFPKIDRAEAMDIALNTSGTLARLQATISNRQDFPEWFREVVIAEREATEIREYQSVLVPGLLQTEGYARTIFESGRPWEAPSEIASLVDSRLTRHEVLAKADRPLVWFVVDEVVIRRPVGGREVMREQLEHLLELIETRRIRLQVVPLSTQLHPGLCPPFRVMGFRDRPPVAYVEHMLGGDMVDQPDDVSRCNTIFGALQGEALSTTASADLIRAVVGEI